MRQEPTELTSEMLLLQLRQSSRERGRGGCAARMGRATVVLSLLHGRRPAQEINGQVRGDGTTDHDATASEQLVPSTNAYPATGASSEVQPVQA